MSIQIDFKSIKKKTDGDHIITFDVEVESFEEAVKIKKHIEIELKKSLENQTDLDEYDNKKEA